VGLGPHVCLTIGEPPGPYTPVLGAPSPCTPVRKRSKEDCGGQRLMRDADAGCRFTSRRGLGRRSGPEAPPPPSPPGGCYVLDGVSSRGLDDPVAPARRPSPETAASRWGRPVGKTDQAARSSLRVTYFSSAGGGETGSTARWGRVAARVRRLGAQRRPFSRLSQGGREGGGRFGSRSAWAGRRATAGGSAR